tara:strand:+ start:6097 stop:6633 length:537 start_codon:yes stop_codon:yes gene_type:complete
MVDGSTICFNQALRILFRDELNLYEIDSKKVKVFNLTKLIVMNLQTVKYENRHKIKFLGDLKKDDGDGNGFIDNFVRVEEAVNFIHSQLKEENRNDRALKNLWLSMGFPKWVDVDDPKIKVYADHVYIECRVCLHIADNIVFNSCEHIYDCCNDCLAAIKECPICQTKILSYKSYKYL